MFQEEKWPFIPTRLSEIIEQERLGVIQAGSSARLGGAITILDYDPATASFSFRIESINGERDWGDFCALLRDDRYVQGGDRACQECDLRQAPYSLAQFREEGKPFRSFACHMGLRDATYVIVVREQPVALLYTGQHRPPEGPDTVFQRIDALGTEEAGRVRLDDDTREELRKRAQELPETPPDFEERLKREALHIESIAEAEYSREKYRWEQTFLDRLRQATAGDSNGSPEAIRAAVRQLLQKVQTFCRSEYAIFFASDHMGETVLAPMAWTGIPPNVGDKLPHFNWKKAGWTTGALDPAAWASGAGQRMTPGAGIRGDNSEFFAGAGCIIPTALGSQYRGVLVLGPFAEAVNLSDEQRFLVAVANTIGAFALTELEVRYLKQERERWESAARLLTHQLRTALTPITAQIGRAQAMARKLSGDETAQRLTDLLRRTEDLSMRLADSSRQTLAGHVLQVERSDMVFERYPLSVLVANVAEGFAQKAELHRRQLMVEKSVELLPDTELDVARFTIVLSNLLDNAIKYSYPNTAVKVRGAFNTLQDSRNASAIIEIDDLGDEIREEDRQRIFEQGTRALTAAKMGRIPGSGLGLWEARAVIEAHGGEIGVTCEPTQVHRNPGAAFHVVFSVRIPLHHKESKGRS